MDDVYELLDPQDAQRFLKRLPVVARRKGEACFRSGLVRDLVPEAPGRAYSARVRDGADQEVRLHCDPVKGWEGQCTCAQQFDCEHIFAAMSALLAEHRTAAVRSLSGSLPGAAAALAALRTGADGTESGALARRLMVAVGRSLEREEAAFVRKVEDAYARCRQSRSISARDFQQMGLPPINAGWQALEIWPALPDNAYEFWLYVANALQERGLEIPECMAPITELGLLRETLARWRRAGEIERWRQLLGNCQPAPRRAETPTDLRLMVDLEELHLQWLRPGEAAFESLKQRDLRQLAAGRDQDSVSLTPEGELLWQFYLQRLNSGFGVQWRHLDAPTASRLGRLLRLRLLDSRIVASDGRPLARPAEPLRWELTPAASEEDDYRLRLVQADGAPAPPLLGVFAGRPAVYLTADAVFAGPDPHPHLLEPEKENRIPAPAIERASGVALLQSLGLELPPRVRERVRSLSYHVAIEGELALVWAGSDAEECRLNVVAEAADGRRQSWTGYNWLDTTPRNVRTKVMEGGVIPVYDSAILAAVPPLLAPLNLKPALDGSAQVVRVTKKFPEVFAAWLKSVPPHITVQLKGELASFMKADVAGRVKLDVSEAEIDWFDLRVVLDVVDTTLTPEEIKLLLNARGSYVRLEGKGWRRLQFELSDEESERLARLGLSVRELSAEPQRLHALQLADAAARKFLPEQQVERIQRRAEEIKARVAPPLPAGVTAQLRPYQIEGFHFLAYLAANRFGGILADDMGLGKTLQALAWLVWLREQRLLPVISHQSSVISHQSSVISHQSSVTSHQSPITDHRSPVPCPSLVVCPKSVMDNWHAEAARFTPGLRVRPWAASELSGFGKGLASADLHVINYSQLRSLGESLTPVRWQAVILDEGQYIKNPRSQTAQVARALRAQHRLVLSGTPIENRLLDLWSLMAFAMPGVLSSRVQFARLYDAKGDPFARRRLAARMRPFLLRRTKSQVAKDLPDRIEEDLFCDIEGEQQALYRAELKRAQQLLLGIETQKELAQQQFHFLVSLLRLRQICCHPRLRNPDSKAPSAKTDALLEQLEPLMDEGQKVLVFSQFVELLDLLRPVLEERGWPLFYLAGDTENRGELVKNFQQAEGPAVFLISLKAGGFGLNLTAASYVVLFDPWWNPAVENQAIDRTHRIGQANKVIAYRLLIKNSIEEKIRELQRKKKALAEDVLGEEKFAQSLTLDDLRFLFAE